MTVLRIKRLTLTDSGLRNPAIAAILHELNWAETKSSGVRAMRRMAGEAGLPLEGGTQRFEKVPLSRRGLWHYSTTRDIN